MKVKEIIEALKLCYEEDEVEAFGPTHTGHFAMRTIVGVESVRRKTVARGNEGSIVIMKTAIYDR